MSTAPIPPDVEANVRLSMVHGVGPRLRQELLTRFGSPDAIFAAQIGELERTQGIGPKLARSIVAARELDVAGEIRAAWQHGVEIISDDHDQYPRLLKEMNDPPGSLCRRDDARPQDALAIAMVGTRHASRYGLGQAEKLADGLARAGYTVVSGLARGIDAAAHRAALAAGGRTIAVLASGLLNIYPPEHDKLADEVVASGCLLSESHPRTAPTAGLFPQRNRIVSGLSLGTIVVEAPARSGALITARHAYEQGREVFAVPGPVDKEGSRGTHALIKDGAKLVATIDDVLDELGPLVEQVERPDGTTLRQPQELQLNDVEQQVLQAIASEPTSLDVVTRTCGLPVHQVLATVSVLEMRRLVRRVSGNQVARI